MNHAYSCVVSTGRMDSWIFGLDYDSPCTSVSVQSNMVADYRSNHVAGMVLFYCTAVAMKRQDQTGVAEELKDFFDPGEKREFAG
jgi:hypothetical protein